MLRTIAAILAVATLAGPACAEPLVKIINFTADWCPNCQVVDPRIDEALTRFPAEQVELVALDMTDTRGIDEQGKLNIWIDAMRLADSHKAGYLWDWYGGTTGIAAIIAADNGEPISCIQRVLSVEDIATRIEEATILTRLAPPGRRKPNGPDCPPPHNRG